MVLTSDFFHRATLKVAPELLGKTLVRKFGKKISSGLVTEVEAYVGMEDKACHAAKGKTPRTKVMFEKGGTWYVYLCYGMYWMLNIVTEKKEFPAAILIRGFWTEKKHYNGPGKLTKFLKIDKTLNGASAEPKTGLWFEDEGYKVSKKEIRRGTRIGIGYAGEWQHKPWRFYFEP